LRFALGAAFAVAQGNGKVGLLAKRVGMERTHLYRKLRSLGVDFRQITED
jgi:transcriptional regulator of acetoin/glycerol metabolism